MTSWIKVSQTVFSLSLCLHMYIYYTYIILYVLQVGSFRVSNTCLVFGIISFMCVSVTPFQSSKPHPHSSGGRHDDDHEDRLDRLFDRSRQMEEEEEGEGVGGGEGWREGGRQGEDSLRSKVAAWSEGVSMVKGGGGEMGEEHERLSEG